MIKVKNISVYNFENALRGARNPLESWNKSDSCWKKGEGDSKYYYYIGENDMKLALKLIKAGSDHRKFMRQIFVSIDITAPMTWWWDMDTYKVATVRNSTSRMHKLGTRLLTKDDFSWIEFTEHKQMVLEHLNYLIEEYQKMLKINAQGIAQNIWTEILEDLPESYNFLSTWTGNYEVLRNIYHARKNHKQKEFRDFCKIIEELPNSILITVS
jgi:hypothetical protein